jgi:hypothetical protein
MLRPQYVQMAETSSKWDCLEIQEKPCFLARVCQRRQLGNICGKQIWIRIYVGCEAPWEESLWGTCKQINWDNIWKPLYEVFIRTHEWYQVTCVQHRQHNVWFTGQKSPCVCSIRWKLNANNLKHTLARKKCNVNCSCCTGCAYFYRKQFRNVLE